MPIVDYNRIYHVQSRERKPVLNPVNVPDAAGAFIRAGVPAAGASLPGLRARLDDANARYRERVGRDRDRFRAIGDLIGVGKDVALAYAGAVERRDEADLNALQAAWQDHMAQGAEDAWRRPYKRGGENGAKPDGPLVAIRELDAAFDESDAMNGARPAVKQRFAEWRRRASQSYYTKGQRLQADAQDNFQQNALVAKWQASNDKIKTLYGLEDQDLWEAEVQNAIEGRIEDGRFQMGRKGLSFTAEQEAGLRDNLRQEYEVERANYWCAVAASSTEPTGGDEELGMAAMVARDLKDDAARLALEGRIEAARQSRERNHAAAQGQIAREADSIIDSIRFGDVTGADFQTAQDKVRELVQALDPAPDGSGVKLSGGAAKLLDDLDKAVADRELINFATEWNDAAWDFQKEDLEKRLRAMPEGRAKDAITKWKYGGVPGGSSASAITPTKVGNLCVRDVNNPYSPRQVHEMVVEQFMRDGDLVKLGESISKIRSFMNFRSTTGERATQYLESIGESLGNAFGVKLGNIFKIGKDGLPVFDKDGNPVPADGFNPSGKHSTRIGERYEADETGQSFGWTSGGLTVSNQTLQEGYRLGMEYIVQRLSGFDGKGGRPSKALPAVTPESVKADLSEYFKTAIPDMGDMLTDHILAQTILDMRQKSERLGVEQYLLDKARRAYFDKQAGVATGGIDDKETSDQ